MKWFAAELHNHTLHSDGSFTTEELLRTAVEYELDCIALTDHNTTAPLQELTESLERDTLPVIRGIEWTTFFGHMLVLGCEDFVDWRDAKPDNIDEKIRQVRQQGGLVGIAHPFALGSPMCTGCYWDFRIQKWEQVQYMELWSEGFPAIQTASSRAVELWTGLLDKGYRIAAAYGKDWHGKETETLPSACTYLGTEEECITSEAAMEAIEKGRTVITMGPLFAMELHGNGKVCSLGEETEAGEYEAVLFLDMEARKKVWQPFSIRPQKACLYGRGGRLLGEGAMTESGSLKIPFYGEEGFVRAQLWGSVMGRESCIAMTSPVYIL